MTTIDLIKTEALVKDYALGEQVVHALQGVSVTIQRGEMVTVMGASGSGKSTLINILGCLDVPSAGHYLVEGRNVTAWTTRSSRTCATGASASSSSPSSWSASSTRAGERGAAAVLRAAPPQRRRAQGPGARGGRPAGPPAPPARAALGRRAASAPRSRAPWPTSRPCCWPTSPPATSTPARAWRSWP